ncbi:MAG: hypothetical protein ABI615_09060 [Chthoniobacterales bacterium]
MKTKFFILTALAGLLGLGSVHAGGGFLYRGAGGFAGNASCYRSVPYSAFSRSCYGGPIYGYNNWSPSWYSVSPLMVYYSTGSTSDTIPANTLNVIKVPPPVLITTPITESSVTFGWRK